MKAKRNLLIGIILGILIGWSLGFLRFPYIENNFSFWVGFMAGLALFSLGIILVFVWNKNALGRDNVTQDGPNANRKYLGIWILAVGCVVSASVMGGIIIYRQNESFKIQTQNHDKKMQELSELMESVKKGSQTSMLNTILDHVGDELKRNQNGMLSDSIIASIAALSFSCKPYQYFEGDSLSEKRVSPERGQLLLALFIMQIDSVSFNKIKLGTTFSGADLKGADLKGIDLSGADLRDVNLKEADLSGGNLDGADLSGAILWGANLNSANLSRSDLKRADLKWADLNGADLKSADLNGADLTNAQLRKADLTGSTFQWAQSNGALLIEANLTGVNFLGSGLTKANLNQANLSQADLRKINLSEADLTGAELNKALVDENWTEKLKEWRVQGVKEIQEHYTVANDSIDKWGKTLYRLKKN